VFAGVAPRSGDWTEEVKAFFSSRVVDKTFIVYVEPLMDSVRAPSLSEKCQSVVLVESRANRTFIYIHSVLADECQGVQQMTLKTLG